MSEDVFCVATGCCDTSVGLIVGKISFLEVTVIELGLRFCVPASKLAGARFACLMICESNTRGGSTRHFVNETPRFDFALIPDIVWSKALMPSIFAICRAWNPLSVLVDTGSVFAWRSLPASLLLQSSVWPACRCGRDSKVWSWTRWKSSSWRAFSYHEGLSRTDTLCTILASLLPKQGVQENRLGAPFVLRDPANSAWQPQPAAISDGVQHARRVQRFLL